MARHDYDDIVSIRRDSITGLASYGAAISDMHFGMHRVCRSVSRAAWGEQMQERGMVYCDSGHCILVPTVWRQGPRSCPLNGPRLIRAAPAHERSGAHHGAV